jgi:hypothetical protein
MSPALYQEEEEEEIRQTTGEHLGHLKDLEISKYKRRSFKCPKCSPVVCLISSSSSSWYSAGLILSVILH